MTKPPARPEDNTARELKSFLADGRLLAMLNYALLFFMIMTVGGTGVIALLICTFAEDKAPDWIKTHYQFQLRTFWIGIAPVLLTVLVALWLSRHTHNPYIYYLVFMPALLWVAGRVVMGFNSLLYGRPYPKPRTWLV